MSWHRRSRSLGSAFQPLPFEAFDGSFFAFFAGSTDRASSPISSTEQIPMPYALRRARFTARVSATRISAPRTTAETFDGSASPKPTNPLQLLDLYTVALKAQRDAAGSENSGTG